MRSVGATTAPRWLNDSERRTWIAFLYSHSLLLEQVEEDLQRDVGMPLAYYQLLVVLSEHPNRRMRMSDLAAGLLFSRSRLSHAVSRLEENGWLRRERCGDDRRGSYAVLTDEGFAVLEAAAPDHVESVRTHLFEQLSPEEARQLGALSETLVRHLVASLGLPPPTVLPDPDFWGVSPD
jgi:DNA-binding MarR family transcriptional regulator